MSLAGLSPLVLRRLQPRHARPEDVALAPPSGLRLPSGRFPRILDGSMIRRFPKPVLGNLQDRPALATPTRPGISLHFLLHLCFLCLCPGLDVLTPFRILASDFSSSAIRSPSSSSRLPPLTVRHESSLPTFGAPDPPWPSTLQPACNPAPEIVLRTFLHHSNPPEQRQLGCFSLVPSFVLVTSPPARSRRNHHRDQVLAAHPAHHHISHPLSETTLDLVTTTHPSLASASAALLA